MLISIILPCYKVEKYVARCIESLISQDLPQNEYEIICINDCSPDKTRDVIEAYQSRYSNITLINHSTNQTAGGARNTGIRHATGKYLWFVDPDDEVEPNSLRRLYELAESKGLDCLLFGFTAFDEQGRSCETGIRPRTDQATEGVAYVERFFPGKLSQLCMMVNVLYRRQYLLDNDILFPCIKASQDVVFAWNAMLHASRVQSVDDVVYIVHKRPESTTGKLGRNKADKIFSRTILFPYEVSQIRSGIHSKIIRDDLEGAIRWCVNDALFSLSKANRIERKKYYGFVQSRKDEIHSLEMYMNRATKWLQTNYLPFFFWDLELRILQLLKRVRGKWF